MDELIVQAEGLGIKVDKRWSAETLQEQIDEALLAPPEAPKDRGMFAVKLLRNYAPDGDYEIVGDPVPPPYPGVGFPGKLWAGTVVKLPIAEAKMIIENQHQVVEKTKSLVTGEMMRRTVLVAAPIAERMDAIPI